MKMYKLEGTYNIIEIGSVVEADYEYVKVLSIFKIDFSNSTVWFTGILNEDIF
jgi:hypothetical protein